MCCTVIEGKCKRCISDPWTVHSVAKGAYVKEIPRDLISHFNYCRQWRGSLAGALKLLLVFAIILCEFELCCYCFICSCSDHHANSNSICIAPSRRDPLGRGVAFIMIVRRTEGCAGRRSELLSFAKSRVNQELCAELGGEAFSLCQQLCHTDTRKDNSSSCYKLELAVFGKLLVLTTRRQLDLRAKTR